MLVSTFKMLLPTFYKMVPTFQLLVQTFQDVATNISYGCSRTLDVGINTLVVQRTFHIYHTYSYCGNILSDVDRNIKNAFTIIWDLGSHISDVGTNMLNNGTHTLDVGFNIENVITIILHGGTNAF